MSRRGVVLIAAFVGIAAIAAAVAVLQPWRDREPTSSPVWDPWVLTIAGDGRHGMADGPAERARFVDPFGVAAAADGTIYAADGPRLRRLTQDRTVTTVAERFGWLSSIAIDDQGTIYAADSGQNVVWRVTPDGASTVIAGDGTAGYRDGPREQARFNAPVGIAVAGGGRVVVADTYNDRIRVIDPDGRVWTLAGGSEPGFADGVADAARFDTPSGVAIDRSGRVLVADTGNNVVRVVDSTGAVTTVGGGLLTFERPTGIGVDEDGTLYVTEDAGRISAIAPDTSTRVIAGAQPGFNDGIGIDARFRSPAGVTVIAPGTLVIADAGNALVRLIHVRPPGEPPLVASPLIAPGFDADAFWWQPLLWPLQPLTGPHEIAGTLGEARGDGAERFHSGIDVRAPQGTLVLAVRDGVVTSPIATGAFGSLNEWLRIGDLAYIHLRAGRDIGNRSFDAARFAATADDRGRATRIRVKRGARFETGDTIGTINAFNHVHLNVGWAGEEHNPLRFRLAQYRDSVPPTIAAVRVHHETGTPITGRREGRLQLSGRVRVIVDAWDQMDGNRGDRRLGVYALGYQVLNVDGSPAPGFDAPRDTLVFDRMPRDEAAPRLVYAPGSGIPFYGTRRTRFLYMVTSRYRDGVAADGLWDTTLLAPGPYTLRVRAADYAGNEAMRNRDLPVTIVPPHP
jgi:hypothetical protein